METSSTVGLPQAVQASEPKVAHRSGGLGWLPKTGSTMSASTKCGRRFPFPVLLFGSVSTVSRVLGDTKPSPVSDRHRDRVLVNATLLHTHTCTPFTLDIYRVVSTSRSRPTDSARRAPASSSIYTAGRVYQSSGSQKQPPQAFFCWCPWTRNLQRHG